jgi:hypothetical protein
MTLAFLPTTVVRTWSATDSQESVGSPSVKRKQIGLKSPFCSAVVRTTSRLMQSSQRRSAAPSAVPEPILKRGIWNLRMSVSGTTCWAELAKVMTLMAAVSRAIGLPRSCPIIAARPWFTASNPSPAIDSEQSMMR